MNAPLTSTHLANPADSWLTPHEKLGGKSLMDHLFSRLDGMYPVRWKSAFPNQNAIDNWLETWAEAFEEEGITPAGIKAGLKACRTRYDWPPSCAEFIKACKPCVDPMVAYYEAVAGVAARNKGEMGEWSHPAIYWASVSMAYDLGSQTFSQIKGRWEQALAEQMGKGAWAAIPGPKPLLPAPGKGDLSRENAKKMVEELGAGGVLRPKTRHREWIDNALEDEKSGKGRYPSITHKFAHEASAA